MMLLRWCWGDVVVILLCGYWGEVTARCCPENICQVEGRESTNKRPGQSCQLFMGSNLQCAGPACRSSPQTGADWQTGRLLCLDVSILQPPLATCWHFASQATRPDVLPRTLSCSHYIQIHFVYSLVLQGRQHVFPSGQFSSITLYCDCLVSFSRLKPSWNSSARKL